MKDNKFLSSQIVVFNNIIYIFLKDSENIESGCGLSLNWAKAMCRLGFWLRLKILQAFARKSWALSRGFQAEPSHNITNLQSVFSLFPPKTDVTLERLGAASHKLVHRFCSYKRTNLKKNLKKSSENSYLQSVFSLYPPKTDVTLERLGAAFRKLVRAFRSYKRTNKKKN